MAIITTGSVPKAIQPTGKKKKKKKPKKKGEKK
jgi:hypothetical protein